MRRSRVTLATIEAAATAAERPSPPTSASWGTTLAAQREPVDEDRPVDRPEEREGAVESKQVAVMQPAAVDRRRRERHDGQAPGAGEDAGEELFAPRARELLGVVQRLERGEIGVADQEA